MFLYKVNVQSSNTILLWKFTRESDGINTTPNVIKGKLWQHTTLEERLAKKRATPEREPKHKCTREKKTQAQERS